MNQDNVYKTFIYAALPCEAKPLVAHFNLKKDTAVEPFAVYLNRDICLTVTGPGKSAMAAGIAYTQALFASAEHPVMLNVGIAGHKDHALGTLFLIDRIIDLDSGKNHYPPLVCTGSCATGSLQTASRPQLQYDQPHLYDMEASAFYETATRFSCAELVQCLKVVSDNKQTPAENIEPKQVSALIAAHIPAVEALLTNMTALAKLITSPEPHLFSQLVQHYHFTASERVQLKNLLCRWNVLTDHRELEFDESDIKRGKDVLRWLDQQIDKIDFCL
jgi:adenosylhomocysteine nucleosidase